MTPRQELRQQQREDDIRLVMQSDVGRRFVWRLLCDAGLYADTFAAGAPDVTAFRQGRRAQALELLAELQRVVPREVVAMVQSETARDAVEAVPDASESSGHDGHHPG